MPKNLVRSALPSAVSRVGGRLRPRLFLLLDFRPSKIIPKRSLVAPAEMLPNAAHSRPEGAGWGVAYRLRKRRIRADCGRNRRSVCSSSSAVITLSCYLGLVLLGNGYTSPTENLRRFQKADHIVQVACPSAVLPIAVDFLDEAEGGQAFKGCIHRLFIHPAFLGNQSPGGKANVFIHTAVPEQTAVDGKIPWL